MKRGWWIAGVVCSLVSVVYGHGPGPQYIPIPRLIENLTAAIQKKPKEPENYYLLGRVHYFAFVAPKENTKDATYPADNLAVYNRDSGLTFNNWFGSDKPGKSTAAGPSSYKRTNEAQLAHVRAAIVNLNRALAMRGERPSPKKLEQWAYASRAGLYELCLACALEDGAPFAPKVGAFSGLDASSKSWLAAATQNYWLAFDRAATVDLKDMPGTQRGLGIEEA